MNADIAPILQHQLGLVTQQDARRIGMTRRRLDRLVASGELVVEFRGVYRDAAAVRSKEQRWLAAVLAIGADAVLSHRTAASNLGWPNVKCALIELCKPSSSASIARDVLVHRTRRLEPEDWFVHRGIPTTTPARTLVDLATVVSAPIVRRLMEHWLSCGRMSVTSLRDTLCRNEGRPGQRVVQRLFDERVLGDIEPDSPPEGRLGELLMKTDLPPLVHHLVTVTTGWTYELDWSYPNHKIALEMDGYGVHLRSLDAFEDDRHRRNELEIDGWSVLNFTRRQVERRSTIVVDQVRRRLSAASALLPIR